VGDTHQRDRDGRHQERACHQPRQESVNGSHAVKKRGRGRPRKPR
jgi:hypothetical protein